MTDPRPAQRFERSMMALELDYTRQATKALEETRRVLLEILMRLGLSDTGLAAAFRREMDNLSRRAADAGRGLTGPIQEAAAALARSQFEALASIRPVQPVPYFETIRAATEAERTQMATKALASAAWAEALAARLAAETANLQAGGEPVEVAAGRLFATKLGDRASVWRMGANQMELSSQRVIGTVGLGLAAIYYLAGQAASGRKWYKQAVAQLDADTTDCCLAVHGQVQPVDKPFELTGTPRFADQMMHPRFHWRCRTDELLWAEDLEAVGQSTEQMRQEARAQQRSNGK
jgi:hypothetical protein